MKKFKQLITAAFVAVFGAVLVAPAAWAAPTTYGSMSSPAPGYAAAGTLLAQRSLSSPTTQGGAYGAATYSVKATGSPSYVNSCVQAWGTQRVMSDGVVYVSVATIEIGAARVGNGGCVRLYRPTSVVAKAHFKVTKVLYPSGVNQDLGYLTTQMTEYLN